MILESVQAFLQKSSMEALEVPEESLEQFKRLCARSIDRQLGGMRDNFRIRMSNAGRPYCQLWYEKNLTNKGGIPAYSNIGRNIFGDLVEAYALCIMDLAGVDIQDSFVRTSLDIGGITLEGECDVIIDGKVWDIKSASPYSFNNKFCNTFDKFMEQDQFGYVAQGYLYAESLGLPFGGWIAINKSSGEWTVLETPVHDDDIRKKTLEEVDSKIRRLVNGEDFERSFSDVPEYFRRRATGNRVLDTTCTFCDFKHLCWPTLKMLPNQNSSAKEPMLTYYTYLKEDDA